MLREYGYNFSQAEHSAVSSIVRLADSGDTGFESLTAR